MKLRIYFTEFSEDKYREAKRRLAETLEGRIVEHVSSIVKEFRFLEVEEAPAESAEKAREILGSLGIKAKIDEVNI